MDGHGHGHDEAIDVRGRTGSRGEWRRAGCYGNEGDGRMRWFRRARGCSLLCWLLGYGKSHV